PPKRFLEPGPPKIDVGPRRLPALLPENMQDVDGVLELGHIENPVLALDVDANLVHARPDIRHRLPVAWFQIALDHLQFVAQLLPDGLGERTHPFEAVTHP